MTLLDRIKDGMFGLERGVSEVIPGYKGYKQKELRREADKLLRDTIATRMRTVRTQLDGLQQEMISAGKFDLLDRTGSAATQIQTFIDRVRTASYGYGGLFDAVRVKEEELDRVYEFDARLMDYVERIENAISSAHSELTGENLPAMIMLIRDLAREANAVFDERAEVLKGTSNIGETPRL